MSAEALTVHESHDAPVTTLAESLRPTEYVAVYFDEGYTFRPFTFPHHADADDAEQYYRRECLGEEEEHDDLLGEDMLLMCCPCCDLPPELLALWNVVSEDELE